MTFGETLRGLRKQKGQTQQKVASALGISLRAYVSYEKDERRPRTIERMNALARYYDVDKAVLTASNITVAKAAGIQEITRELSHQSVMKLFEKKALDNFKMIASSCGWTIEEKNDDELIKTCILMKGEKALFLDFILRYKKQEPEEHILERIVCAHYGMIAMREIRSDSAYLILSNSKCLIEYMETHPARNIKIPVIPYLFQLENGNVVSPGFVKYLASIS